MDDVEELILNALELQHERYPGKFMLVSRLWKECILSTRHTGLFCQVQEALSGVSIELDVDGEWVHLMYVTGIADIFGQIRGLSVRLLVSLLQY